MPAPSFTITAADVFEWGKIPAGDRSPTNTAIMDDIIDGVVGVINETTLDWGEYPEDQPGRLAATENAITLMSFRVWARRQSPQGAVGFGPDQGLIRVARTDPDVEFFLHPWSLDEIPVAP